jgi:hypothetical protein
MTRVTEAYMPDGSFVSVQQLPNGTLQRTWGHYQATPVSQYELRMDFQVDGWLPRQICSQAPGFPVHCQPYEVPRGTSSVMAMTSQSSFQASGVMMMRDSNPYLLQQPVPDQVLLAAQAPVAPQMTQPVMPQLNPYRTPNGPGQAIAGANHYNAREFIDGNMRGCYKDELGRLWGCQQ